jgi:hypothetical protein
MAKVDVDGRRRLDGSWEVGCGEDQRRETDHTGLEDYVVKVASEFAKMSSRLAQPHAKCECERERVCLFRV